MPTNSYYNQQMSYNIEGKATIPFPLFSYNSPNLIRFSIALSSEFMFSIFNFRGRLYSDDLHMIDIKICFSIFVTSEYPLSPLEEVTTLYNLFDLRYVKI